MDIIKDLKARGILKDVSNIEKFKSLEKNSAIYIGFDPTATSLHLGNYIQIAILKRFESYGFKPYAILGGATGMIGDPSFKNAERKLLDEKAINLNKQKIKKQLEFFGLEVIDNYDWYKDMSIIDFLRNIGKLVNISYLLAKDSIKSRIEKGLSFTEFSYSLLQGYDFLHLFRTKNIKIQFGGSDQWGNLTTGLEMISKNVNKDHDAIIMTGNLLTDQNGNKIGKSQGGGGLWIDKEMNPPFNLYQYFINLDDAIVEKFYKWFSFKPLDEIDQIISEWKKASFKKTAQKMLAFEVIENIYSKNDAQKAVEITTALFENQEKLLDLSAKDIAQLTNSLPTYSSCQTSIKEVLLQNKIVSSNRELNEFINSNSISINSQKITDSSNIINFYYDNKFALVKIGKRKYYIIKNEISY
ncbi:tyrosine--tRNA ligase [Mycoplasma phocimorsus]|uniref:tyrosine--tRNA ligase n=1 Tax=Mycoplasma phocimorsus TaxID=3045839 RepID=UPI0024C0D1D7|nr:tyrosine--tRNA ligase [Mycoplasma phocimorsus]MDJ1646643.1 tyrosine--tRNA ligase [Mycoplasma phocimorsus]MDJ1648941.1 tyrosine--tRNA ligase [Mycoplasma phocimorsus]